MNDEPAKAILARHGKSFYWASFFLGKKLASNAAKLYQFCRFVDDLADGDLREKSQELNTIRETLELGEKCGNSEVDQFIELAKENNVSLVAARELIDGMLADQTPARFRKTSELLRYCHAVAGTVGLMMCPILHCKHTRADSFAIDLGIAMQLTNIARDVLEDAKMGRRYIPSEWTNLSETELSPEKLSNASPELRENISKAIEHLLSIAETYYASAKLGIHLLPFKCRFSILVALQIYKAIGLAIKWRNFAWWEGRVVVPMSYKLILSITSVRAFFPRSVPPHCSKLHIPLKGLAGVIAH